MAQSDVARLVAEIVAAFPNPRMQVGPATVGVYCQRLADIPIEQLKAAVAHCIDRCTYFPTIAEIRTASALAKTGPKRSGLDAWGDVMGEVRRVGYQGTPRFTDPVVTAAVRTLGGWLAICESTDTMADRAHFAKAYDSIAARNLEAVAAGKAGMLPALPERPLPRLVAVGQAARADEVSDVVQGLLAKLAGGDS